MNQLLQMALLFDKSELQCRAYLVAALCLHDAVFFRHDTGCTQGGEHGLQGKAGRVILLREMAQGELFTAALDQFQKLCGALVVGKVSPHALDAGAQIVGVGPCLLYTSDAADDTCVV